MKKIIMGLTLSLMLSLMYTNTSIAGTNDISEIRNRYTYATQLCRIHKYDEALDIYQKILVDFPTAPVLHIMETDKRIGEIYALMGKYNEAEAMHEYIMTNYAFYASSSNTDVTVRGLAIHNMRLSEASLNIIYIKQDKYDRMLSCIFNPATPGAMNTISTVKQLIIKNTTKLIKQKMLEDGKSFVGVEGKKAIEAMCTPIAVALNAPLFGGLEAALSTIGIVIPVQDRTEFTLFASNMLNQIKSTDLDPSTPRVAATMSLYLGVEEWNKFVKKYNGE